jgi:hypothetical protein
VEVTVQRRAGHARPSITLARRVVGGAGFAGAASPTLTAERDDATEIERAKRAISVASGACRDRTGDLRLAKAALSQLS